MEDMGDDKDLNRELVECILSQGKTAKVVFTKKDGSERTLICTKNSAKIPTDMQPKGEKKPVYSNESTRVFDLEVGEWRSFRYDSLISVSEVQ